MQKAVHGQVHHAQLSCMGHPRFACREFQGSVGLFAQLNRTQRHSQVSGLSHLHLRAGSVRVAVESAPRLRPVPAQPRGGQAAAHREQGRTQRPAAAGADPLRCRRRERPQGCSAAGQAGAASRVQLTASARCSPTTQHRKGRPLPLGQVWLVWTFGWSQAVAEFSRGRRGQAFFCCKVGQAFFLQDGRSGSRQAG